MHKNKIIFIIFTLASLVVCGTFGFSYIEGWSLHESLYMTIITLTTTGFQEVHPMSVAGRNLTMILLILGMGVVAYSVSIIMSHLLSLDLENSKIKRREKEINKMKNHTILCGYGRMGKIIADELAKANHDFLIIEKDPLKINLLKESQYLWIEGDATHDEVLHKANINSAHALVSMIDSDADALYLALAARSLNSSLEIIVRASEEEAKPKILRAGANKVVLPVLMSGIKVAQAILNPAVEDFIDLSGINNSLSNDIYQLVDIPIHPGSQLANKSIHHYDLQKYGLVIVGVKTSHQEFHFSPAPNYLYQVGDVVLALGSKDSFLKVSQTYNITTT
jgi:voltage-gated potassium channel